MSRREDQERRWVLLGRVLRARGRKGEVSAELSTDFPDRFFSLKNVYLRRDREEPQPVALERFWLEPNHPGRGVFHFSGFRTISDAEALVGAELLLPIEERISLPQGQYFVTDLIGCNVFELERETTELASPPCEAEIVPQFLGTVRDVFLPGGQVRGTPLLAVDTGGRELLVPLAEAICTLIRPAERRIEVRLPAGLRDLNAEE